MADIADDDVVVKEGPAGSASAATMILYNILLGRINYKKLYIRHGFIRFSLSVGKISISRPKMRESRPN